MAGTVSRFLLLAFSIVCPYAYSIPYPHVTIPRPFHPNHSPSPGYNSTLPPQSRNKPSPIPSHKSPPYHMKPPTSPPHPHPPPPLISNPCPPPVVENQQPPKSVHDGRHPSRSGQSIYCINVHADKNINAHHPQLIPPNRYFPTIPPAAGHDQYPNPATPYKSSQRTPSYHVPSGQHSPRTPPSRQPSSNINHKPPSLTPPGHPVPSPIHK